MKKTIYVQNKPNQVISIATGEEENQLVFECLDKAFIVDNIKPAFLQEVVSAVHNPQYKTIKIYTEGCTVRVSNKTDKVLKTKDYVAKPDYSNSKPADVTIDVIERFTGQQYIHTKDGLFEINYIDKQYTDKGRVQGIRINISGEYNDYLLSPLKRLNEIQIDILVEKLSEVKFLDFSQELVFQDVSFMLQYI